MTQSKTENHCTDQKQEHEFYKDIVVTFEIGPDDPQRPKLQTIWERYEIPRIDLKRLPTNDQEKAGGRAVEESIPEGHVLYCNIPKLKNILKRYR